MQSLVNDLADPLGVLLRREAVAAGVNDNALARMVKSGVLVRQRYGAYVCAERYHSADPAQRHRMLCAAAMRQYADHAVGVALSHASSCVAQEGPTWGLDLDEAHLTHMAGGGRRGSRLVHHQGAVRVGDLRRHQGSWVTIPGRSVLEVTCTRGVEAGLVQANHFLHLGGTTLDELSYRVGVMSQWPDTVGHHVLLALADPRIESVLESRTLYLSFKQGLPRPVPQLEVFDSAGHLIGRVDFAWPEQRVIVEADGLTKYHRYRRPGETIEQMVIREKLREDALREAGWIVIRVVWSDLARPEATAARIRRALDSRSVAR